METCELVEELTFRFSASVTNLLTFVGRAMQYPLTYVGLHYGFTWINVSQAIVLLPLFFFAFYMYRWENADLVPIRWVTTELQAARPSIQRAMINDVGMYTARDACFWTVHLMHCQNSGCSCAALQAYGRGGAGDAALLILLRAAAQPVPALFSPTRIVSPVEPL